MSSEKTTPVFKRTTISFQRTDAEINLRTKISLLSRPGRDHRKTMARQSRLECVVGLAWLYAVSEQCYLGAALTRRLTTDVYSVIGLQKSVYASEDILLYNT